MSTLWVPDNFKNKHSLYSRKDIMKNIATSLGEKASNIIYFEEKENAIVKAQEDVKVCYVYGKRFIKKFAIDKIHCKVRSNFHYTSKQRSVLHKTSTKALSCEIRKPTSVNVCF